MIPSLEQNPPLLVFSSTVFTIFRRVRLVDDINAMMFAEVCHVGAAGAGILTEESSEKT